MPVFHYKGRDSAGKLISGEEDAPSAGQLSEQLSHRNIIPVTIVPKKKPGLILQLLSILFGRKIIAPGQLALFTRQLHTLLKSGISIVFALRQLAKSSRSPQLTQVLLGTANYLEEGQSLSQAMQHYPDVFSSLIIGMIKVGENTGSLDQVLLNLTEYLEMEGNTMKRVKTAVRYPLFVMSAIIIGVILINIFVIPTFGKVYARAHISLPKMTTLLIGLSKFVVKYGIYILISIIAMAIGIYRYLQTPKGRFAWHKRLLKLPVMGILLKRIIMFRFARTFAITARSGIPILEGLTLVSQTISNDYVRKEIEKIQEAIQHGNSMLQAAQNCELFSQIELKMLTVAEHTGELGDAFDQVANYYQREIDYDLKRLTDAIEPILLIGIAVMVLLLALSVYMPIWNMTKFPRHG